MVIELAHLKVTYLIFLKLGKVMVYHVRVSVPPSVINFEQKYEIS